MYRCELCDVQVPPYTRCTRVVVATREKVYPARPHVRDPGGVGHEIAREAAACPDCVESRRGAAAA